MNKNCKNCGIHHHPLETLDTECLKVFETATEEDIAKAFDSGRMQFNIVWRRWMFPDLYK